MRLKSRAQSQHNPVTHLSVGLDVLQQIKEEAARLLGPSDLAARDLHDLGLGMAADTTSEAQEGDSLLVLNHVAQVLLGALKSLALDGHADLAAVLEVGTEVVSAGLGG